MEVRAIAKRLSISAQKVRLVADQVRGKPVADALDVLNFSTKKGAVLVKKTLESAIANAENNKQLDIDNLFVKEAFVGKSLSMKRFRPRAKGRASSIVKPFSKLTIIVEEKKSIVEEKKINKTKKESN